MKRRISYVLTLLILLFLFFILSVKKLFSLYITAGFYYIHYIVTEFFTFGDNIHVINSHLIIIFFVVHIQNILILQLVTIVINFILDVEGLIDINALMFRVSLPRQSFAQEHHWSASS